MRSYGCVMMKVEDSGWDDLCRIIDPEDVYEPDDEHGISRNPHITILFGLLDLMVPPQMVMDVMQKFDAPHIQFKGISIFEHKDFDVVKIDVISADLAEMHDSLRQLPHVDQFPTYKPHATIAFVKKGTGKKYVGTHSTWMPEEQVLTDVIYSRTNNATVQIKLIENGRR